jgi:hypothetical protein
MLWQGLQSSASRSSVVANRREDVRAGFSRGDWLRRSGVLVCVVAFALIVFVASASGRGKPGDPQPIPGGFGPDLSPVPTDPFVHVLVPSLPFEMATIGDFSGTIGASEIQGTARGSDGTSYTFDTDMRFMQGVYVDAAGDLQHGSFAFI